MIVHILATSPSLLRFIGVAERIATWITVMLFVVWASRYTNSKFHRRPLVKGMVVTLIGGMTLLWATSGYHNQFLIDISIAEGPFVYANITEGPIYYLLLGVGYGLVIPGYMLLVKNVLSAKEDARIRIVLLTAAAGSTTTFNLLSLAGVMPLAGFNYTIYGAFPFAIFSTVAVFHLGLLDIVPVARRTLLEELTDPVIVVDDEHRVADYNQEATNLWPSLSNRVGGNLEDLCPEFSEGIEFPESEKPISDAVTLTIEDESRHYSVLISPVKKRRGVSVVGYTILARDVTELEESRRRLTSQNERLDRVAGTVSHDLRNPLQLASGHTELIEEELRRQGEDELVEKIQAVEEYLQRMDAIIDDVLRISRQEMAGTTLENVKIEDVARDAWNTVDTGDANLEIAETPTVLADRNRLQRILENLFSNAIDHAVDDIDGQQKSGTDELNPASGDTDKQNLTVTVGSVSSSESEGGGETVEGFFVADNGKGIPPDLRDTIFEYGFTTSGDGTGIGMASVKRMAHSFGWSVELAEDDEKGARFEFIFDG